MSHSSRRERRVYVAYYPPEGLTRFAEKVSMPVLEKAVLNLLTNAYLVDVAVRRFFEQGKETAEAGESLKGSALREKIESLFNRVYQNTREFVLNKHLDDEVIGSDPDAVSQLVYSVQVLGNNLKSWQLDIDLFLSLPGLAGKQLELEPILKESLTRVEEIAPGEYPLMDFSEIGGRQTRISLQIDDDGEIFFNYQKVRNIEQVTLAEIFSHDEKLIKLLIFIGLARLFSSGGGGDEYDGQEVGVGEKISLSTRALSALNTLARSHGFPCSFPLKPESVEELSEPLAELRVRLNNPSLMSYVQVSIFQGGLQDRVFDQLNQIAGKAVNDVKFRDFVEHAPPQILSLLVSQLGLIDAPGEVRFMRLLEAGDDLQVGLAGDQSLFLAVPEVLSGGELVVSENELVEWLRKLGEIIQENPDQPVAAIQLITSPYGVDQLSGGIKAAWTDEDEQE